MATKPVILTVDDPQVLGAVARDLRIYPNAQKVPYTKNVENDAQDKAAALTLKGGEHHTPVVVVGERAMLNPKESVLERELRKQGLLEA